VYLAVFAPHLITKVSRLVNAWPTEQLFEGVPDQPEWQGRRRWCRVG
jgi:hypothetical protein